MAASTKCRLYILFTLLAAGFLLSGCATTERLPADATVPPEFTIPASIRQAPPRDPQLAQVRDHIDAYRGAPVRWGGVIEVVETGDGQTWIRIRKYELDEYGKPESGSPSQGRFIAQIDNLLDADSYTQGRKITVAGQLEEKTRGVFTHQSSALPLVEVREHYLWDRDDYVHFPRYEYRYYSDRYYRYHPYPRYRFGFHFGHGHHHGLHHGFHHGYGCLYDFFHCY
jgi:outer membrane lipoprotein